MLSGVSNIISQLNKGIQRLTGRSEIELAYKDKRIAETQAYEAQKRELKENETRVAHANQAANKILELRAENLSLRHKLEQCTEERNQLRNMLGQFQQQRHVIVIQADEIKQFLRNPPPNKSEKN